jgi:lipid A ethanolaminephosphotransferase
MSKFGFFPRMRKWTCDPVAFLLIYSIANAALFQRPLYALAVSRLPAIDLGAVLALSTLFVLQFVVTFGFLTVIAMVTVRLARALCIALLFGNAIALYFIDTYGVVIDRTMMGNAFNTDLKEAFELAHPKLLLYVLLFAIAPAALVLMTHVTRGTRRLAISLAVTCVLGMGWIYANAKSWLWLDQNFSALGGLILPWSYVVNSVRYHRGVMSASGEELMLPPARVSDPAKAVVVLVIGEAARAKNFSLYGYSRNTNPLLSAAGVVALQSTRACATYTTESIRCMLSHLGGKTQLGVKYEPLPTYVGRHGVDVQWRSNNTGEPPLKVGSYEKASDIRKGCQPADCERLGTDEVLLEGLEQRLRSPGPLKRLVVLHQHGSHGPLYFKRYTPEFEVFRPACQTVDLQKCTAAELVNAYDNTIVYTDYLLSRVISMLKSLEGTDAVMVYVSDHGQSLGEYGLYLHGTPYFMAPDVQKEIPFIVWMSDAFAQRRHLAGKKIGGRTGYSHDAVFHSVMGALGLESDIYNKELDIFRAVD